MHKTSITKALHFLGVHLHSSVLGRDPPTMKSVLMVAEKPSVTLWSWLAHVICEIRAENYAGRSFVLAACLRSIARRIGRRRCAHISQFKGAYSYRSFRQRRGNELVPEKLKNGLRKNRQNLPVKEIDVLQWHRFTRLEIKIACSARHTF